MHICAQCLEKTVFQETGHENNKKFDLYKCPNCGSYNREWSVTDSDQSLVTQALSANRKPKQMRMFPPARDFEY